MMCQKSLRKILVGEDQIVGNMHSSFNWMISPAVAPCIATRIPCDNIHFNFNLQLHDVRCDSMQRL